MRGIGFVLAALLVVGGAEAATLHGMARVVDGDTLVVDEVRVRLHGIDAPEQRQTCDNDEGPWPCGRAATQALTSHIGDRPVTCDEKGHDRYGRVIAFCALNGEDIEAWMVRQGWAVAYRRYSGDYITEEAAARATERGLWSGRFDMPWEWRHTARAR